MVLEPDAGDKYEQSQFLNQWQAADFLNIGARSLERFRMAGDGPIYRKFGNRVLYARSDLLSWADSRRRVSTSAAANSATGTAA